MFEERPYRLKLTKEDNPNILSTPVHKGKPIKQGLLRDQLSKAGFSMEKFLKFYS